MVTGILFHVGVGFAIVTGTGAGLFALLSWEIFRRSPLGRAILMLSITMSVFILYHVLLLGFEGHPQALDVVESMAYTGVVGFIGAVILSQRRLREHSREGDV